MRKEVGEIRLDFYSHNEVAITDRVPVPTPSAMYLAAFPFLFAAKLLNNFPPPTGRAPIQRAISVLPDVSEDNIAQEVSLLGMCSEQAVRVVEKAGRGKWIYEGRMFSVGESELGMETKIAKGDEDHFHRAAIDTVFEWFRKKWELGGGLMCLCVKDFLSRLAKYGPENLSRTYTAAFETGNFLYTMAMAKHEG